MIANDSPKHDLLPVKYEDWYWVKYIFENQ